MRTEIEVDDVSDLDGIVGEHRGAHMGMTEFGKSVAWMRSVDRESTGIGGKEELRIGISVIRAGI